MKLLKRLKQLVSKIKGLSIKELWYGFLMHYTCEDENWEDD